MSAADDDLPTPGRVWTAADRRRAGLAGIVSLLLVVWLAWQAFGRDDEGSDGPDLAGAWPTSGEAEADVPDDLLPVYQAASQNCPGLPWPVVAAIGKLETDHNRAPGTSEAGAVGPMQFLPTTWQEFQADGDGDGVADIENEDDAIAGAVRYLCASGGEDPSTLRDAVFTYNRSEDYVTEVLVVAGSYTTADIDAP